MTDDQDRRRPPAERFEGDVHAFDLHAVASELRDEGRVARDGHRQITLFHEAGVTIVLFDFEAGGTLADHSAAGHVTIQAITGQMRVTTPDAGRRLLAGSMVLLAPGVHHDIRAIEPSLMLLTVHLLA